MKYAVKIYPRAYRDLDEIYAYIAESLMEQDVAVHMLAALEEAILSLEQFPERGSIRRIGAFANQGYRQLFVRNYTIIYRVHKEKREVYIVTVRYSPSQF